MFLLSVCENFLRAASLRAASADFGGFHLFKGALVQGLFGAPAKQFRAVAQASTGKVIVLCLACEFGLSWLPFGLHGLRSRRTEPLEYPPFNRWSDVRFDNPVEFKTS